ncbi:hypothetical protein CCACVL1_01720 [Corchorus capsularis]|uniref:Uncharacterized protein n=1 Tax=Corchorus capsularis TaxID=210143 RepID=A0A1R3KGC3_COCAP|nr:hypothetical protein CCACVL1_01720 [Corchorus capsularis]
MYPFAGSKPLPPSSPRSSAMATPAPQPFKRCRRHHHLSRYKSIFRPFDAYPTA